MVLPRTNVGLELRDGVEALMLDRGDPPEIADVVSRLAHDPELAARIGAAGRAFAVHELRWSASVDKLEQLLDLIAGSRRLPAPAWALDGADPPVRLIAVVRGLPEVALVQTARACGIFGFCLDGEVAEQAAPLRPDYPFCLRLSDSERELIDAATASIRSPAYIRIGAAPLLVCCEEAVVEELRRSFEAQTRDPVHIALVASSTEVGGHEGVDSVVEAVSVASEDYLWEMHASAAGNAASSVSVAPQHRAAARSGRLSNLLELAP